MLLRVVSKASLLLGTQARCFDMNSGEVLPFSHHDRLCPYPRRCPEPFLRGWGAQYGAAGVGTRSVVGMSKSIRSGLGAPRNGKRYIMAWRALASCAIYSPKPDTRLEALLSYITSHAFEYGTEVHPRAIANMSVTLLWR